MKQFFLSFFLLLRIVGTAFSQIDSEAFELYQKGKYLEAAAKYEALINNKVPSADLYYNVGTCYFAAHDIAQARLALERALLLHPGSRSIQRQLNKVTHAIEPNIEPLPNFFLVAYFVKLRDLLNNNTWGWLLLVFSTSLVIIGMFLQSPHRNSVLFSLSILTLLIGILFFARYKYEHKDTSILMNSQPMRIAPEISSQQLIQLGVGTKAHPIDSLGEWYKVALDNNDIGWLPKGSLRKI